LRIEAAVDDLERILGAREIAVRVRVAGKGADLEMNVRGVEGVAARPDHADLLSATHTLSLPHGDALQVAVRCPALEAAMLEEKAESTTHGRFNDTAHLAVGRCKNGRAHLTAEVDAGMRQPPRPVVRAMEGSIGGKDDRRAQILGNGG